MNTESLIPESPRDGSCDTDVSERHASMHRRKILVADDDENMRVVISSVLAGAGFEVNTAADGLQAWGALLHQHEAIFPSASLPLTAEQPTASDVVHNRILIADDDALVRGSLAAVLESEGYVVDEARNGIEAVTRAIEHLPVLVLLDLNMPHWDGWTAFSQLDRVTPLLPVIVITARPNQYEKAVRLGVDAFMEKPLNIPILVRAVKCLTSEDESRHVRRITNPAFVTQLLDSADS